jgi:transposase
MVSYENIETVKGKQWGYILGLQRRNRKVIGWLLKKVDERQRIQEFGWDDLSEQLKGKYEKKVRFVVRYNEKVAQKTRKVRERKVGGFEDLEGKVKKEGELKEVKKSNDRLKGYLRTKRMSKYYKIEIKEHEQGEYRLEVERNEELMEKERLLDGRYFLQTEESQEMSRERVDESYRSLQIVERAFRAVKGDLEIRPVHVTKETRIRGHVMIAYFALLIERLMEKKLKELYPQAASEKWVRKVDRDGEEPLTMMTLYEELDGVRLIPLVLKRGEKEDQRTYVCTKMNNNVKKVLSAVGVKNAMRPERLSFAKAKKWRDEGQLMLDF